MDKASYLKWSTTIIQQAIIMLTMHLIPNTAITTNQCLSMQSHECIHKGWNPQKHKNTETTACHPLAPQFKCFQETNDKVNHELKVYTRSGDLMPSMEAASSSFGLKMSTILSNARSLAAPRGLCAAVNVSAETHGSDPRGGEAQVLMPLPTSTDCMEAIPAPSCYSAPYPRILCTS
jgi:hypothetical protein